MEEYRRIEKSLAETLGFGRRPVAVKFQDTPPASVAKFTGTEPSGCSFWRLAAEGRTFYTVPGDHYNCPIGCYTHNISLPPERAQALEQTLGLMASIGYIRMEEVTAIPRLPTPPGVVLYAPLGDTPFDPDVVIFAGPARPVMLLEEAALRAGRAAQFPILGRPTCMAIPASIAAGTVVSTGCIGNRVYTGVGDDELYVMVPGKDLARVAEEVGTVTAANAQLAKLHQAQRTALATE